MFTAYRLALLAILGVLLIVHTTRLTDIPRGLYLDELANGYNAYSILHTAHDEHGELLPIYFKSFGDYKHPIFIYAATALTALFGFSEFTTRLTSVLFFFICLGGMYVLTRSIFEKQPWVAVYATVATGFLPWFFLYSRVAFAAISQVAVAVWLLIALHYGYYRHRHEMRWWLMPACAGALAGIFLYTYSTSRLLAFITVFFWIATHPTKRHWKKHAVFLSIFLFMTIPYIAFSLAYPGALTARFDQLAPSITNQNVSLVIKAKIIGTNYLTHWSPDFLLFKGDGNRRLATGAAGQLFIAIATLAAIGAATIIARLHRQALSFERFVVALTISAPLAASLTEFGVPHATRSILLGLYLTLISCYGMYFLLGPNLKPPLIRNIFILGICIFLSLEIATYLGHFFTTYPDESVFWFQDYKFKQSLQTAVDQKPQQITLASDTTNAANQPYMYLLFYKPQVQNPDNIPIVLGDLTPSPNECFLYFPWNNIPPAPKLDARTITLPGSFMQAVCYAPSDDIPGTR